MNEERKKQILQYLAEVRFAKIERLAELFEVSQETIRRDLIELEKTSAVRRVWGGASYNSPRANEMDFSQKSDNNIQGKNGIARLAAEEVQDGDAIVINNGVTTIALARQLAKTRSNLTVVTNSLDIAMILSDVDSNRVYLTSGYLRKNNRSLVGNLCNDILDTFKVDKSIITVDGISIENGVMEYNTEEASVLRKMISIGHIRMVLADYGKFSEIAFHKVCNIDQINCVITDNPIPAKELKRWEELGIRMIYPDKK